MKTTKIWALALASGLWASAAQAELTASKSASTPIKVEANVAALMGLLNASVGYGVSEQTMVGVSGVYSDISFGPTAFKAKGAGVFATQYLKDSRSDSYFVKGSVNYFDSELAFDSQDFELKGGEDNKISTSGTVASALFGKQWLWENGISVNLAGGLSFNNSAVEKGKYKLIEKSTGEEKEIKNTFSSLERNINPALEINVGYTI